MTACEYNQHRFSTQGEATFKVTYRQPLVCGCEWPEVKLFCEDCLGVRLFWGTGRTRCPQGHVSPSWANIVKVEDLGLMSRRPSGG